MNADERNKLIEAYREGHQTLIEALRTIPRESWHYRPAPGRWTINEIVVHMADSELNGSIRLRSILAEPGKVLMAYDQNKWAKVMHYDKLSPDTALELLRIQRVANLKLLQTAPEESWGHRVEHPEEGSKTLEDWLATYAKHVPGHINQIQDVFRAWQER